MSCQIIVRPMETNDIPQVARIESEAFPEPWPATDFRRELTFAGSSSYLVAHVEPAMGHASHVDDSGNGHKGIEATGSKLERLVGGLRDIFAGRKTLVEQDHLILGYAGVWFMVDEAHLASIAVRREYRSQGIGELIMIKCIELSILRRANYVTLEVRRSNLNAQSLYQKYGLVEVGVRRGYYTDNKEDALIMTVADISSASYLDIFEDLKQSYTRKWPDRC